MVITHNVSALNTYKSLGIAGKSMSSSMEKLSSGYKINRAGDDAAGLSISEKMRSQIRGLNQASTNAAKGVSMIQTAEGGLNETHSILQRIRELAVQAATDTNADEDRVALQSEVNQLIKEVERISSDTEFNGMKILDGSKGITEAKGGGIVTKEPLFAKKDGVYTEITKDNFSTYFSVTDAGVVSLKSVEDTTVVKKGETDTTITAENLATFVRGTKAVAAKDDSVYFHVGANKDQVINVSFEDMGAVALGIGKEGWEAGSIESAIDVTTREGANRAIETIDSAIKLVSRERSKYGAIQNRLEYTMNNLDTTSENMTAAESTIRDVDMAKEMMEYTKNSILQQAAQAMLVQANQRPQQALQLLTQ